MKALGNYGIAIICAMIIWIIVCIFYEWWKWLLVTIIPIHIGAIFILLDMLKVKIEVLEKLTKEFKELQNKQRKD